MYLLLVACSLVRSSKTFSKWWSRRSEWPIFYTWSAVQGGSGHLDVIDTSWHWWQNSLFNETSCWGHSHDDIIVNVITVTSMTPPITSSCLSPTQARVVEKMGVWRTSQGVPWDLSCLLKPAQSLQHATVDMHRVVPSRSLSHSILPFPMNVGQCQLR